MSALRDIKFRKQITLDFEYRWENTLGNVTSENLRKNWDNNFSAFGEIISLNQKKKPGKKICCPSPTGSGKTQQIIHKAIDLYGTDIKTLIVVMRTEDADIIASQIKTSTHDDYVAVMHSKDVSEKGVRKTDNPKDVQCLIITHEMFRRRESTITHQRDFIVIDEAIDVITQTTLTNNDLENIIRIIEKVGDKFNETLQSELRIFKMIQEQLFEVFKESNKNFIGLRAGAVPKKLDMLPNLDMTETVKLIQDTNLSPSKILLGIGNDRQDSALKIKYTKIADEFKNFFRQFNFLTKRGRVVGWHTASELVPEKSIVIMDATASVNKSYELYMKYMPERLEVLPSIDCRDYSNVILHTMRTATGRYTILGHRTNDIGINSERKTDPEKLIANVVRNSESGEKILVVSFTELEASLKTFAEEVTDRVIDIDHWGNLTGTNKYQHHHRVFIVGLNHKPDEVHRNMHALIKTPAKSFKDTNENKSELASLARYDIVAEVVQAINRIRCRRVVDSDGNCPTAEVYLTLPSNFHDAEAIQIAIKQEMQNITIKDWDMTLGSKEQLNRVFSIESFMIQLEVMLKGDTLEISLQDILDALGMTKKQYRDYIKGKSNFKNALDRSPFFMEMRNRFGYRGKKMKTKEAWFVTSIYTP